MTFTYHLGIWPGCMTLPWPFQWSLAPSGFPLNLTLLCPSVLSTVKTRKYLINPHSDLFVSLLFIYFEYLIYLLATSVKNQLLSTNNGFHQMIPSIFIKNQTKLNCIRHYVYYTCKWKHIHLRSLPVEILKELCSRVVVFCHTPAEFVMRHRKYHDLEKYQSANQMREWLWLKRNMTMNYSTQQNIQLFYFSLKEKTAQNEVYMKDH